MIGGNVTKEQWQEVERIVRSYQRSLLTTFNHMDKEKSEELTPIVNELYEYAHGTHVESCPPCEPQTLMCKDHLTDE